MVDPLRKPSDKADRPERRPGLGLAKRGAVRGASCRKKHCNTGRSCCRSRTPSFADRVAAARPVRVSAKCGACVVALLVLKLQLGTFVARLAIIRIAPETRSTGYLFRGSLTV